MKYNDLISIIVPVFNVEKYVSKCIDSILAQTYENIEIILIDDGSTDNSYEICKEYENKYNNIKLYHKSNGGLSSARNKGIKESHGDFITFVDSDDELDSNFIKILYYNLIESNAEISVGKLKKIYNNNISECEKNNVKIISDNYDIIKEFTENEDYYACGLLYNKTLFNDIEFPVGKYYEDIGTTHKLFLKAKIVCYTSYDGYLYFIRNNSISMSHSYKKIVDGIEAVLNMYNNINEKYPKMKENIISSVNSLVVFLYTYYKNNYDVDDNTKPEMVKKQLVNICGKKYKIFFALNLKNKLKYIDITMKRK